MRITTNQILRSQLQGLQSTSAALVDAQQRVTTGLRVRTMSDDAAAANTMMLNDGSLRAIDQYRRNIEHAQSRVAVEDEALRHVGDLLTRARELAVGQATATATPATRLTAAAEVEELLGGLVQIGNTSYAGEFFFGGDQGLTPPFAKSGSGLGLTWSTPTGAAGTRSVEIGSRQALTPTHDGDRVFVQSGVLDAVRELAVALHGAQPPVTQSTDQSTNISAAAERLDAAFQSVQALVGETGAKANTLELTRANLDAFSTSLTAFQSDLRDVDIEQAVTELVTRQTAYQAAMLASSKVLNLNLADYLR